MKEEEEEEEQLFGFSSAEKRRHSVYKQLTSCSTSSSSDDELKELQLGDRDRTKRHVHMRHKPPQKERKIVSLSSPSPDDDEVFSYSKPGCVSKRLKCSAPQPISGRYRLDEKNPNVAGIQGS